MIEALSSEELEEVRDYIAYRHSKAAAGEVTSRDYRYWQVLCQVVRSGEGNLKNFVYGQGKQKGFGIKPYRAALAALDLFIATGTAGMRMTRPERTQLVEECFRAVALRCHHLAVPITHTTVLTHTRVSLSAAMEWQYPGYFDVGMLHLIVRMGARHVEN